MVSGSLGSRAGMEAERSGTAETVSARQAGWWPQTSASELSLLCHMQHLMLLSQLDKTSVFLRRDLLVDMTGCC